VKEYQRKEVKERGVVNGKGKIGSGVTTGSTRILVPKKEFLPRNGQGKRWKVGNGEERRQFVVRMNIREQ